MDRPRAGHVQRAPARVAQALAEVDLVGVDEERRVEPADLRAPPRGARAAPPTAPSRPRASRSPRLCTVSRRCRNSAPSERGRRRREAPGRRLLARRRGAAARAPAARRARLARRAPSTQRRASRRPQLGVLVEQQRVAPARALQQRACRSRPCRAARSSAISLGRPPGARARRARPSRRREALSSTSTSVSNGSGARSAAIASRQREQQLALLGVDDAEGDLDGHVGARAMMLAADARPRRRPPGLHAALRPRAVRGARRAPGPTSSCVTSRFALRRRCRAPDGYARAEALLPPRAGARAGAARGKLAAARRPTCCATRAPRRDGRRRPLPVAAASSRSTRACCRRAAPRVLTAHDVLPREPRPGQRAAQRRLYERVDAVVVHSEHGARAAASRSSASTRAQVHVIPHGVFDTSPRPDGAAARRARRAADGRRSCCFFGLLRPYKGLDVLLEALARRSDGRRAAGRRRPRMDSRRCARGGPPGVRLVDALRHRRRARRATSARADLVVLPYREIDQSGVLFTALAFGTPLLLTRRRRLPRGRGDRRGRARAARRRRRAARGARRACSATPRARARCRGGAGAPRRALLAGTRSRARTLDALRELAGECARRDRARDPLLGRARRCSSTRRSATRCCSRRCARRARRGPRARPADAEPPACR